ncbi:MAG TPA: hypothetical protein VJB87_03910, partial [Candidatus Nanoarchaeia archaeon]|nr:hypothetical protein [Candidatus Nanoarchaeia archaeon]
MTSLLTTSTRIRLPPRQRIRDLARVQQPDRIVLAELPLGSLVEFEGAHPLSQYLLRMGRHLGVPQVMLWLDREHTCAIGGLDAITTTTFSGSHMSIEYGIIVKGQNYVLPTFHYDGQGHTSLDHSNKRFEPYTKLWL